MWRPALLPQCRPLLDAKAVLLIDDHEPQPAELDVALDQRVRADRDVDASATDRFSRRGLLGRLEAAAQKRDVHRSIEERRAERQVTGSRLLEPDAVRDLASRRKQPAERLEVLLRQDLGRRHDRALVAGSDGGQQRRRGHYSLAASDITLQQAAHRHIQPDVRENRVDRAALGRRHLERKRADKAVR